MPSTVTSQEALPLILTMKDVIAITGLSRDVAYRLPHRPDFPAIRFGRTIKIPRDAFLRWIEAQVGGNQ